MVQGPSGVPHKEKLMTVNISYQQAVDLLELAVEERGPSFTYVRVDISEDNKSGFCAYFDHDGSPSCIVGWVLNRLGIDAQMCWNNEVNEESVSGLVSSEIISIDFKTYTLLAIAQALQDSLVPWGQCLEIAKECAEHIVAPDVDMKDWLSENDGWDYLTVENNYDGERIGFFQPPNSKSYKLPLFEEIKAPELTSIGHVEFVDDKGKLVSGEALVEVQ